MNMMTLKEIQVVMKEKERQGIMKDGAELLAGRPKPTTYTEYTKLLSYKPRYALSIPIYEFWDEELEWKGRTFKLIEKLSRGYEYTARYRETTDEKENKE